MRQAHTHFAITTDIWVTDPPNLRFHLSRFPARDPPNFPLEFPYRDPLAIF